MVEKRLCTINDIQKVVDIVLGAECDRLTPHARFVIDMGCDMLDMIELHMFLEKEFDIVIPDEYTKLETVQELIDEINKLIEDKYEKRKEEE